MRYWRLVVPNAALGEHEVAKRLAALDAISCERWTIDGAALVAVGLDLQLAPVPTLDGRSYFAGLSADERVEALLDGIERAVAALTPGFDCSRYVESL